MKTYRVWFGFDPNTLEELQIDDYSRVNLAVWSSQVARWDGVKDEDKLLWVAVELEM